MTEKITEAKICHVKDCNEPAKHEYKEQPLCEKHSIEVIRYLEGNINYA